MHSKITQKINKKNDYDECPLCNAEEPWERVTLCEKNKKKREDWTIDAKNKFQVIVNNRNAALHESKIIEDREKEKEKCFKMRVIFTLSNK